MAESQHLYDGLGTREGFNRSLKHFKYIMGLIEDFEDQNNLAEILEGATAEKTVVPDQILPILNAILLDKYRYHACTLNMKETFEDFDGISREVAQWNAVDLVAAYFHPELGVVALNPKIRSHWDTVQSLRKNEMITVYAGAFGSPLSEKTAKEALSTFVALLNGEKTKAPASLLKGTFGPSRPPAAAAAILAAPVRYGMGATQAPITAAPSAAPVTQDAAAAPQPVAAAEAGAQGAAPAAPSGAPKKMTPMYGIVVSNELFHNGNVEAWKKIIASYTNKYKGLEVFVFYEGERIHDINTLFKWGKVKHGSTIMISVAGDEIKDVAKLQRYLKQGASHMFEAFLKAPVSAVLNLF
jgi:hypothetical protein